jgi:hypothetical protein
LTPATDRPSGRSAYWPGIVADAMHMPLLQVEPKGTM